MKRSVAIIGGGPAALMLAATLDENKFDVSIYEKNFAPARKFLVAGDGGFNLTHSENIGQFILRYTPVALLEKCLRAFTNEDLREWLKRLGIETFVGSSKRVFPVKGIKPIDVLNAILEELKKKNVSLKTLHEWKGWDKDTLLFEHGGKTFPVRADLTVFALGGASWAKTGSAGNWTNYFLEKNIVLVPFRASNCAYQIDWEKAFISQWEGKSLKNISFCCNGVEKKGEVIITKFGVEGGPVYALSPQIREHLLANAFAEVSVDLKPGFSLEEIKNKLQNKRSGSFTQKLKEDLNLSPLQTALLKSLSTKEEFADIEKISKKIKSLPLKIKGMAPIDEAISTVGGITLNEVDENFQLKKLPGHFAIGEMLDWDAPTGGYLLQACFSMGHAVAETLNSA